MTDDRRAIARAVAMALDLAPMTYGGEWTYGLRFDGSNVFDLYWIWRCIEWLLEQDIHISLGAKADPMHEAFSQSLDVFDPGFRGFMWKGPVSEFPARAVAALMKGAEE